MHRNPVVKTTPKFRDQVILLTRPQFSELDGKTIKAQTLWFAILEAQVETGNPYMLFKDACNGKSNQQNLGCIKSSNLCTEIVEYTSPEETAVCNLASIALSRFVVEEGAEDANKGTKLVGSLKAGQRRFDFKALERVTKRVAINLNKINIIAVSL